VGVPQNPEPPTVAQVVGRNARRLRGHHTADELARGAKLMGLKWGTGRISELEAGKVSPTLPTLFVLALVLGEVTGQPVSLADLLHAEDFIRVNEKLVVKTDSFTASVSSKPVDMDEVMPDLMNRVMEAAEKIGAEAAAEMAARPAHLRHLGIVAIVDTFENSGEAEKRIAKGLGIGSDRMVQESTYLWGDSFSAERDRRAGPDANAQKRGRVSRELKAELRESLNRGRD